MSQSIPSSCKALVCPAVGRPLQLNSVPVPTAIPGSAVIRVLASTILPDHKHFLAGKVPFMQFPTPIIPGSRGVGRVAAVGVDATSLHIDQLVLIEPFVRGRDDPDVQILLSVSQMFSPTAKRFMENAWRNGLWTEFAQVPLENCYALNEKALLGPLTDGGLGYEIAHLPDLAAYAIAYGGLRGIDLKAGETVIVAPATGVVSGAAVAVASAMGARVIAMSRNAEILKELAGQHPRISIVQTKGNSEDDAKALETFGTLDALIDFSPASSPHTRTCLMALKQYGKASLMGVIKDDIPISYLMLVAKNLTIRGQFMYEREDVRGIIKLAETGVLKLGESGGGQVMGQFQLEDWEKALDAAEKSSGAGKSVTFTP